MDRRGGEGNEFPCLLVITWPVVQLSSHNSVMRMINDGHVKHTHTHTDAQHIQANTHTHRHILALSVGVVGGVAR